MDIRLPGLLLREERLKRSYKQAAVCRGLCTVSYLSKIEQGKAAPEEGLLTALLARLDIPWRDGEALRARLQPLKEAAYQALFSMDGRGAIEEFAAAAGAEAPYSPFLPDRLLFTAYLEGGTAEAGLYAPAMDGEQRCFLLYLQGEYEKLLPQTKRPFYYAMAGNARYIQGRYAQAVELLNSAQGLAAEAGELRVLLHIRLLLGNCASDLGDLDTMEAHYRVAARMAAQLGDRRALGDIAYNIGASLLERGRCGEALEALRGAAREGREDFLYYHKLALAQEGLGNLEEARESLAKAEALKGSAGEGLFPPPALREAMLAPLRYRLSHREALGDEAYARLLQSSFKAIREGLPAGYARFHLPYMEACYSARRQYRELYRLLKEFS